MICYSTAKIKNFSTTVQLNELNLEEQKEVELLKSNKKVNEYVASRFLIKELLSSFTTESLNVLKSKKGKPYFSSKRASEKLALSYSHSTNYISAAVADVKSIGIDVEEIKRFDHHKAFNKWLTKGEINELKKSVNLSLALCILWTKKESLCKATGLGFDLIFKNHSIINKEVYVHNNQTFFFKTIVELDHVTTICNSDTESDDDFKPLFFN